MPVFADHAPEYLEHDIPPFPVAPDGKKPLVTGWQQASAESTRQWAGKFPDANLGIGCGPRTGITEVDVDAPGENALADAVDRFGETPVVIRTASGKAKLWYAHNGERRMIRPVEGMDVDVLGGGFTIAPPSERHDIGGQYRFLQGSLDDLDRLPAIQPEALPSSTQRPTASTQPTVGVGGLVPKGQRDDWLFRRLLREVRAVDSEDDLRDVAHSLNGDVMSEPLPDSQVEAKVRQVLKYEAAGSNFASVPRVTATHREHDELLDAPYAAMLLLLLRRNHSRGDVFAISPKAMANAGNPPWPATRIRRARDVLVNRGFVACVHEGKSRGDPSLWRFV